MNDDLNVKAFEFEAADNPKEEIKDSLSSEPLTKTEKIKKKKKKKKEDSEEVETKFWRGIYLSLKEEEKSKLKKEYAKYKDEKEDLDKVTFEQKEKRKKEKEKQIERVKNYGAAMGINKIVMLNPEYFYVTKNGDTYKQDLLKSEKGGFETEKMIREIGKMTRLNLVMLDKKGSEEHILQNININNQIISWIGEKLKYDDSTVVLFENQYSESLIKDAGTEYLGFTVVRSVPGYVNDKKNLNACLITSGGLVNPLCLGWGLYQAIWGQRGYTQYTFVLFNIRTNKIEYLDYREFYAKATSETINQLLYNSLNGIKRKN